MGDLNPPAHLPTSDGNNFIMDPPHCDEIAGPAGMQFYIILYNFITHTHVPSLKIQNDSPNQIFAFYIHVHGRIGHGSFQKEIVCSMGAAMQWKFARESILPLLNHSKPRFSHGFPGKSLAFYSCRGEVSSSGLHR